MENAPDDGMRQRKIELLLRYLSNHYLPLPIFNEYGIEEALIVDKQAALEAGFTADGTPPKNPDDEKIEALIDGSIVATCN